MKSMHFILLWCLLGMFYPFGYCINQENNNINCKNGACPEEKWHSHSENYENKSHEELNEIFIGNNSDLEKINHTLIEEPQPKSYNSKISEPVLKLNDNDEYESKTMIQKTTEKSDIIENKTVSSNAASESHEPTSESTSQTKAISQATQQYATEATTRTTSTTQMIPSSNGYSFLFNVTNNEKDDVCFCDLQMNECDINCCCDSDCGPIHWRVFTHCDQPNYQHKSLNCYKNHFLFKNNTKLKVVHVENGLFCIAKGSMESNLLYPSKELITSLKSFDKSLPKNVYSFAYKEILRHKFEPNNYKAGSFVWILRNGDIEPFSVPEQTLSLTCKSKSPVKYLVDQVEKCSQIIGIDDNCEDSYGEDIIENLRDMIVIANPHFINKSLNYESVKVCQSKVCILPDIHVCRTSRNCTKVLEKEKSHLKIGCSGIVFDVQYRIWHNGTEGIRKFDAFVFLRNVPEAGTRKDGKFLRTVEVQFRWAAPPKKIFKRSGNPGYLTGKPILTCKKGFLENGTGLKKDVMEWSSTDADNVLHVLGSEKGFCSPGKRIPINFQENSHHTCSLELSRENFGKANCTELQKKIFRLLLGEDLINVTSEIVFNKFVATFGNSKLEDIEDWVRVLIDLFPIASSQVDFKFGHSSLMCKNIISDLVIDVAYSNVGSFLNPQAKILGVSFQFGKHKDFEFYCDSFRCESTTRHQLFKLSSTVNFIDLTEPVIDVFAEPLGLEVKLPHDFFYPFFSQASSPPSLGKFVSGLFLLTLFSII